MKRGAATAGALTLPGIAGCLGGQRNGGMRLGVGYQPHYFQAASGILAAARVDEVAGTGIDYSGFLSGSAMISSMVSEQRLVGYMGDMPGLVAADEEKMDGGGYIVAKDNSSPGATLSIVTRKGEFDGVEDLDDPGVVFKVNHFSYAHRWMLHLLDVEGFRNVGPGDLTDGDPTTFTTQLRQGSIDAFANWEPFPSNALFVSRTEGNPELEILATGEEYPEHVGMSVVVFHPKLVEGELRDLGVAWLGRHREMHDILNNRREEAVMLLSEQPGNPGVTYPQEVADRAMRQMEKGEFDSSFGDRERSELREGIEFLKDPSGALDPVLSEGMTLEDRLDTSLLAESGEA